MRQKIQSVLFWILGFLVLLAPMYSPPLLVFGACACCIAWLPDSKWAALRWSVPFVLVSTAAFLSFAWFSFDWESLNIGLQHAWLGEGRFEKIRIWLSGGAPPWIRSLIEFLTLIIVVLLTGAFECEASLRRNFFKGLLLGSVVSLLFTIFQIVEGGGGMFPNQSELWSSLHRLTGTFTDPNAFGFVVFFLIVIFYCENLERPGRVSYFLLVLSGIWFAASFFSGSRSSILGLGIFIFFELYARKRRIFVLGAALGIASFICINVFGFLVSKSGTSLEKYPISVRRLVESADAGNIARTFFSRVVFSRVGLEMWKDRPLEGHGYNSFEEILPRYLKHERDRLLGWTDNANNYYVGVLAELGLLGFFALFLTCLGRRARNASPSEESASRGVYTFLIMLLLGPHLDLPEVAILFSYLLSLGTRTRTQRERIAFIPAPLLIGALVPFVYFLGSQAREFGFYGWEWEGERGFRWIGKKAYGLALCHTKEASIWIRATTPDLGVRPLDISVRSGERTVHSVISDSSVRKISFECAPTYSGAVRYELEASRVFVPADYGGKDLRVLGVQVSGEGS